jgi:glucosylceramidase
MIKLKDIVLLLPACALIAISGVQAQTSQRVITSAKADSSYLRPCGLQKTGGAGVEIRVFPDVEYQTFLGFGTCIGDANAYAVMQLPPEKRQEAVSLLYGQNPDRGNGYVFARVPMGSNDFSTKDYTCISEGDTTLKTFNIRQDKKTIIPTLRIAKECAPELRLMVSPWSPPKFMKSNVERIHGGKLLPQYRALWAEHFVRFINAYSKEGFTTEFVTIQNEPDAVQTWESCIWSGKEEGEFAVRYLRPRLNDAGLGSVNILFWDHNREQLLSRACASLGVSGAESALAGIANHWYEGDHFGQLRAFHEKHPEKLIVESEFCTGPNKGRKTMPYGVWNDLELFGHEIIGCLNNYTNAIFDFNAFLNTKAGPMHNRDTGGIPSIVIDAAARKIEPQPAYYAMAHFSRYIRPGAKIIASSCKDEDAGMELTAAKNTDGTTVCVILNKTDRDRTARLYIADKKADGNVKLPAHSLTTVLFLPDARNTH